MDDSIFDYKYIFIYKCYNKILWNQKWVAICLSVVIVLSLCLIHRAGEILVG